MDVRLPLPGIAAIDRRALVGIGLAAVAALLVLIVTRPDPSFPVLVAANDLPAGTPLGELELDVRHVSDGSGLVEGSEAGDLSAWTLRVPVAAGEPLLPSLLMPPEIQQAPNLLALELDASHAVLGRLASGDVVDVYVTKDEGLGSPSVTELLAERVFVVDARVDESNVGTDRVELLLAVDEELAALLAAAARSGDIDLVRVGP